MLRLLLEFHRHGVHAITQARRLRPIFENVTEVTATTGAEDLAGMLEGGDACNGYGTGKSLKNTLRLRLSEAQGTEQFYADQVHALRNVADKTFGRG